MLRRYSKTLSLIVIAALLYLGDFSIELLAPDLAKIFEQDPRLKPLLWLLLLFCLAVAVFLFVREHNAPASQVVETADTVVTTEVDQENRRKMLERVRHTWIEGVLHKSLWNEARLILNLEGRPDAVVRPCELALRRAGQPDTYIQPGTSILEVYQREHEELLLLGDPGSGKTTLLLEIAEALLQEAKDTPSFPIPVVFNLSSWRSNHTQLDEWLIEQLNRDYGVPLQIGKRWVEKSALLLLLDGLDEVARGRRAACVEAINEYRLHHQKILRPIVVCCRLREYDEISNLRLGGAVVIQPLTRQQVDDYLKDGGKALTGLRAVLKDEPMLYRELFETPLMLHVAVITYEGQSAAVLRRSVKPEERRNRLWDAYVDRMFERKQEEESQYEKTRALNWLAWLGSYLTRQNLQKYFIEEMQPSDLLQPWQYFLVRWCLPIFMSCNILLASFMYKISVFFTPLVVMLILFSGVGYGRKIHLSLSRLSIRNFIRNWKSRLGMTVTMGGCMAIITGGVMAVSMGGFGALFGAQRGAASVGAILGATLGGTMGVLMIVFMEITDELFEVILDDDTKRPNEGITGLLPYSAVYMISTALIFAVLLIELLAVGRAIGRPMGIAVSVGAGTTVFLALFSFVLTGGRSVVQHYLLRLFLWRSGRFPLHITPFLDWAAQRVLVQRVGGGWRFMHRTLQERFAERYDEKIL